MNLYELPGLYQDILDLDLDQETMESMLLSLNDTLEDKTHNIACVLNQQSSDINTLDEEIKRLQAKKTTIKNKSESLKKYLSETLQELDVNKVETPLFKVSFRKSEKVIIDDTKLIPNDYVTVVTDKKIDKKELKKALKDGDVNGCHLEVNQNLQIK